MLAEPQKWVYFPIQKRFEESDATEVGCILERQISVVNGCINQEVEKVNTHTWIGLPYDNLTNTIPASGGSFGWYREGQGLHILIENGTTHVPCTKNGRSLCIDEPSLYINEKHGLEFVFGTSPGTTTSNMMLQLEKRTADVLGLSVNTETSGWWSHEIRGSEFEWVIQTKNTQYAGSDGTSAITVVAHVRHVESGMYDIDYVRIHDGNMAYSNPCGIMQECLLSSGGITPDLYWPCDSFNSGRTEEETLYMCEILTGGDPADVPPMVETKRKWGALEISIVSALSAFTTAAITTASYLYYRLRRNAEGSEDGVRLAIAKP
jgi:hypothetical protein